MLRRHILNVALCGCLLAVTPAMATLSVNTQQEETEISYYATLSYDEAETINSIEDNSLPESELNRKAIQAEKARNAAENDRFGGAITIIAMSIVLSALVILSILFLVFGKISSSVLTKRKREAHGVTPETSEEHHEELDSGEVIAAIGMALAEHFGQGHDMEDTILTIKRMKKAYSPWNSKIYNMRHIPEVHHAQASLRRQK